jgi:hypothetical protein
MFNDSCATLALHSLVVGHHSRAAPALTPASASSAFLELIYLFILGSLLKYYILFIYLYVYLIM